MKSLNVLICLVSSSMAANVFAKDAFIEFEKQSFTYAIPTNTAGTLSDAAHVEGTNFVYQLTGQTFAFTNGTIQTAAEGFDGKTDESTPWETLTELLAAYQGGCAEAGVRTLYDDASKDFLDKVYGDKKMQANFEHFGRSIAGMRVVMGYDYMEGFIAYVRLDSNDGGHMVLPFYFVLKGAQYKLSAFHITKPDPGLQNISLSFNK